LEDFVKALINKADYGALKNNELILDKRVGHGKDADVFRSTWLGLPVAIKYLKSSVEVEATSSKSISPISSSLSTQNEYKIFSNEVAIMMGLRHQNIISIMGFGVDPPSLFIVMEYMEKGSLFSLLGSDQEISGEEKLRFSMNIADALAHMHDRNPPILHSDLKSLNILVDKDGVLKVSDFGISREMRRKYKTLFPEETDQEGLNSGNEGTIQWQPPETFTSTEYRPSKAQDMYAFGVILWEISTRRKPWKGTARRTIAENVCKGYRPLVLVSDKWSPEFEGLVNKCWNQSASKRPTFSRVKKMLKRIQTINEP
jgi:serine/threonine protein kinase